MAAIDYEQLMSVLGESENEKIPSVLPMLPIREVVIFTDSVSSLFVSRKKSVNALDEAEAREDKLVFIATQRDSGVENPGNDDIFTIGAVCKLLRMVKLPDGSAKILVHGISRARILAYTRKRKALRVRLEILRESPAGRKKSVELEALLRNVRESVETILDIRGELTDEISHLLYNLTDPGRLSDIVASNMRIKTEDAQMLLETLDPFERLKKMNRILSKEVELSTVQAKIQSDVRDEIFKHQKDYFLREQMRAINKELGEDDEKAEDIEEYKKRIKKAKMPAEADAEAKRQLKRFSRMHADSSEASVIRNYLDWLVELPWSKSTKDRLDIEKVKDVLEKEHYGLDKVKDRILEFLSVRTLNPKLKGPILCFTGPPGVGKTSLGKAVAKAMKRKFIRISLGGLKDEAEIRGHRRTYIGALPGRIIQELKNCKSNNPVFMMDEIDKIGDDFRGDPASALLEALDPEQNSAFSDHYVNLNFDLSKVMFILTANMTDTIPPPLLDRLELINISGYTEEEKLAIAKKHLYPKQIRENGLSRRKVRIADDAFSSIINEYTSESGVRNLERKIGRICRQIARKTVEGEKGSFKITGKNIEDFLGVPKYYPELDKEESQAGLATGLAWTQTGGEAMYVETSLLPGKGELILTGQLGEVMQESARAALTFAKAHLNGSGKRKKVFENTDIHIHVPAGAIPKDGPSAGIAMAASLISAVLSKPLSKDVAMTGEITLRGRVLPVGGLKEKALGGIRAGIKEIIIPAKNKRYLEKIPETIREKVRFTPVSQMDEALKIAMTLD